MDDDTGAADDRIEAIYELLAPSSDPFPTAASRSAGYEKLRALLENGEITEEEYAALKERLDTGF